MRSKDTIIILYQSAQMRQKHNKASRTLRAKNLQNTTQPFIP